MYSYEVLFYFNSSCVSVFAFSSEADFSSYLLTL